MNIGLTRDPEENKALLWKGSTQGIEVHVSGLDANHLLVHLIKNSETIKISSDGKEHKITKEEENDHYLKKNCMNRFNPSQIFLIFFMNLL